MEYFLTESSADLVPGIKLSYLLKLFMGRLKPNETDTVDQFLQNWDNDLVVNGFVFF